MLCDRCKSVKFEVSSNAASEPYLNACRIEDDLSNTGSQALITDRGFTDADAAQRNHNLIGSSHQTELPHKYTTKDLPVNVNLACLWIKNCLQSHENCTFGSRQESTLLPTLLINVSIPDRPFLELTSEATIGPYLALSYCWGNHKNLKTLLNTKDKYSKLLPMEELPRTVKDSINVTRVLGFRYLWIDALCIVQDDEEMRNKELGRMGDVYRNALFTIYAKRGQSCDDGLFEDQDPRLYRPCQLKWLKTTERKTETYVTLTCSLHEVNHLENRGWVLQEEILSSRRLIFGRQMSWACTTTTACETHPVPKKEHDPLTNEKSDSFSKLRMWLLAPNFIHDTQSVGCGLPDNGFDTWYDIVTNYSTRKLTLPTDTLPALSGLATQFSRRQKSTYIGGLWREDLQVGLAWYVALNESYPGLVTGSTSNNRPTWSWASVENLPVRFRGREPNSTHLAYKGIEVLQVSCPSKESNNPYGQIFAGALTLRGSIKKATLCYNPGFLQRNYLSEKLYSEEDKLNSLALAEYKIRAQFPALLLRAETEDVLGMAALDRPAPGGSAEFSGQQTVICSPPTIERTMQYPIWCLLLSVFRRSSFLLSTCLLLDAVDKENLVYRRRGIAVLKDTAWSGLESLDVADASLTHPDSIKTINVE
ncbi:hypothetical protein N7509_003893 [Penicillium cosmopolitanum]|uniref:Heterokaryon incompatibility domain-containing protein n=1 Tax=Penicillium cosmopolitanum TaxID=1131564 RepID=A0A9X0BBX8_9EURO|nr:uncharacterized protein N7509_003893 [Penicillium cosmopolitanum]KAJ5404022.1 hypothetical protein N7509_003893 [Penicillium cosmopolitanum]